MAGKLSISKKGVVQVVVAWTPYWVFVVLKIFRKKLLLVDSLWCTLQDVVNVIGCGVAGGSVMSSKMTSIMLSTFYSSSKFEIIKNDGN